MSANRFILVGHANGDVHKLQVMSRQDPSTVATEEAQQIGHLTNSGFRTVVAAVWWKDENKTAGLTYAAAWRENKVEILLHFGDRIATSHELYEHCKNLHGKSLTADNLIEFCRRLRLETD